MTKQNTIGLLVLLLLPLLGFSQGRLKSITLFEGKVELMVPKKMAEMSDEMWALKYRSRDRPAMVLTDDDGEVNLLASQTAQSAGESQMAAFVDFQMDQLKKQRSDLFILDHGVRTVNGKNVGFFKFHSTAADQKVFNYYFFIIVDGKIVLFTFNCIDRLRGQWEDTADQIVGSLKVK
ncbi:MAG TPA: DcrB-related protein [Puia sp.]|jgi:hypothetical protein|nr:DcrB-related protein [Puia sp.]